MGNSRSKKNAEVHQFFGQNDDELLEQNAGIIVESFSSRKTLMWEIRDFFAQQAGHPQLIKRSPFFCFGGGTWYLLAFPNGTVDCTGYIVLSLILIPLDLNSSSSDNDELLSERIHWKLEVKRHDNSIFKTCKGKRSFRDWKDNGYEEESILLEPSEIADKKSFSPDGCLTVICELRMEEEPEGRNSSASSHTGSISTDNDGATKVKSKEPSGADKLAHDLEKILLSGDDSDATIKVEGQEFRAHRSILGARAPVFASVFKDGMTEDATGITVSVDDCEADTFRAFLLFVYTGTVRNLSSDNAPSLYEVADKYQVDELKAKCVKYMKNVLSIDTFCDVIAFALRHEEQELVKLATDFYSDKMEEIMVSAKWKIFREEDPTRAKELLMKSLAQEYTED